jgi:hypothetical protein
VILIEKTTLFLMFDKQLFLAMLNANVTVNSLVTISMGSSEVAPGVAQGSVQSQVETDLLASHMSHQIPLKACNMISVLAIRTIVVPLRSV